MTEQQKINGKRSGDIPVLQDVSKGAVHMLQFPLLEQQSWISHGFSTRMGGVSEGCYASMNLSFTKGDDPEKVRENYRRMADMLGMDMELSLIHIFLTKMDGDTRGGAALSIKAVTGKPILYIGMGEKLSDLEQFYPDRMASRILGMGDILSLIEKAEMEVDQEKAKELTQKLKKAEFDFNEFLDQMRQIKKMGGMASIMSMMPGMPQMKGDIDVYKRQGYVS